MANEPFRPIELRTRRRARFRRKGCLLFWLAALLLLSVVVIAILTRSPAQPTAAPSPTASMTPIVATVLPPTQAPPSERLLSIPALGITRSIVDVPIMEGSWQVDELDQQIGRLAGTAPVGDEGNVVLVGHITLPDNRAGPFIDLANLAPGDKVMLQTREHRYLYTVEEVRVIAPDDLSVVMPADQPTLTLLTCTGWDVPAQRYTQRLRVIARLTAVE